MTGDVIIYSHREEVGSHEDPEGASDHLPREYRPDSVRMGWPPAWVRGPPREPDRDSGRSPETDRAARHGSESALDVRRDHRDPRAVIRQSLWYRGWFGTGEDPADKPANPQFKVPGRLTRAHFLAGPLSQNLTEL